MKGDPENIDISNEVIDSLIDKVNSIYAVQFEGGEPMLAIDRIRYFLEAAKRENIVIFGILLVTNGTILNDEIISVFKDWHNYIITGAIKQSQIPAVSISEYTEIPTVFILSFAIS